jgi:hypothetical protein
LLLVAAMSSARRAGGIQGEVDALFAVLATMVC